MESIRKNSIREELPLFVLTADAFWERSLAKSDGAVESATGQIKKSGKKERLAGKGQGRHELFADNDKSIRVFFYPLSSHSRAKKTAAKHLHFLALERVLTGHLVQLKEIKASPGLLRHC